MCWNTTEGNKNQHKGGSCITKSKLRVIDAETGEIVDGVTVVTDEQRMRRRKYWQQRNNAEKPYSDFKSFVLYLHKGSNGFENLKPQTAARLVYLSTYLSYKDNILYYTRKTKMNKSRMAEVLGLKRSAFDTFLRDAVDSGLLFEDDDGWKLSPFSFRKGDVENVRYDIMFKVYVDAVRDLYRSIDKNMHQYLGYVFLMLPFVNTEWNIVCKNDVFETDLHSVEPMSVGEFCDTIGYGRANAQRLIKNFHSIRFPCDGEMQRFCSFVWEPEKTDMRIFINPNVFYAGKHPEQVEALGLFFDDPVD